MKIVNDYPANFFKGKKVLVRVDYNVPLEDKDGRIGVIDDSRIRSSLPTLNFLSKAGAKIILLSHLGKPEGKKDPKLSLSLLVPILTSLIDPQAKILFSPQIVGDQVEKMAKGLNNGQIMLLENLRFDSGEENNEDSFVKKLASLGDFYIDDAFSACHRKHASIVGLPKLLPAAAGLALAEEVSQLQAILAQPARPLVLVVGGVKSDKLEFVTQVLDWADKILLGGLLPKLAADFPGLQKSSKVVWGKLSDDEQDLGASSQAEFKTIINQSQTVIFAGPVGNTGQGYFQATKTLFQAAIDSQALVLAGGGDTQAALTKLGLVDSMDYIASGGGAMLDFLAKKTLPGILALK